MIEIIMMKDEYNTCCALIYPVKLRWGNLPDENGSERFHDRLKTGL